MHIGIRRVFHLYSAATAILPMLLIGLISLFVIRGQLLKGVDNGSITVAHSLSNQITTYLSDPDSTFRFLSMHLSGHAHPGEILSTLLDNLTDSYSYFESVYLLDRDGIVRDVGFEKSLQLKKGDYRGMDFSSLEICRNAAREQRMQWQSTLSITTGEPSLAFCTPLADGAVLATLRLANLGRIINAASSGTSYDAFIVDRRGRIIVHPDPNVVMHQENVSNLQIIRDGFAGKTASGSFDFRTVSYRGSAVKIEAFDWVLVVAQDMDSAMAPVRSLEKLFFAGILATLMLTFIIGSIASSYLARPFAQLSENAHHVIEEEYDRITPLSSRVHEVALLSETLEKMVDAVKTREELLNEQTEELMATGDQLREQISVNELTMQELQRSLTDADDAHRKLADIIEFLPDATFIIDAERRVISWNRAVEKMTVVPKEEMLGKGDFAYAVPFYGYPRSVLADLVLDREPPADNKYDGFSKSGDALYGSAFVPSLYGGKGAYISVHASPLYDSRGEIVGAIETIRDISNLRQVEEELRNLNLSLEEKVAERTAQLESANRALNVLNDDLLDRSIALQNANKELESFAYSISHDLRAPLRHIGSFTAIIAEEYEESLDEKGKDYLRRVLKGCKRMEELIDAILNFSRISRLSLGVTRVDMAAVVSEILADSRVEIERYKVETFVGTLPECSADRVLVKQVMANLIGNALKYSRNQTAPRVEIGASTLDGETLYFVKDNGAGFDMQYANKLFGVFSRLHRQEEFEGTGVGLAIAQNIIQRHGGRIWAEAAPGQGATFSFTLPA